MLANCVTRGPGAPSQELHTPATLRQRVLAGETTIGTFIFSASPFLVEVVARVGLDWLLIDLEHGTADESDLLPLLLGAAAGGTPALLRVESGERIRVGRALDLGASGVMVPQVHSAEQARRFAGWMRTQPAGDRGIALFTRGMDYGLVGHTGVAARHESLLAIVQIESRSALDEVEGIAAVDGIDVLFVGPTDLSHALGIPGRIDHPTYVDAVRRVARAAIAAGKAPGVLVWDPEDVGRYAGMGFSFFSLSSEANTLDRALRSALGSARQAASAVPTPEVT
jgi:2-dehydro-3-deoxyglucarate aldolase/4-hydroxy-2-oxoheptanedioate aldolase